MPISLTVQEFAELQGVAEQTVRGWVGDGLPVVRRGRIGGPGSLIDAARAPAWLARRHGGAPSPGAALRSVGGPCDGNFLRWLVEFHHLTMIDSLAAGWRAFYDDERQWQELGLSEAQGREFAWRGFLLSALHVTIGTVDCFDDRLERETAGSLDDWASLLFTSDFQTSWSAGNSLKVPEVIAELIPKEKLDELIKTVVDLPASRNRDKG